MWLIFRFKVTSISKCGLYCLLKNTIVAQQFKNSSQITYYNAVIRKEQQTTKRMII